MNWNVSCVNANIEVQEEINPLVPVLPGRLWTTIKHSLIVDFKEHHCVGRYWMLHL